MKFIDLKTKKWYTFTNSFVEALINFIYYMKCVTKILQSINN